jgi:two-component system invasion response regulator UvrY
MIRILVADDNPAVRRHLRGVLEQQVGWQVSDEVGNGVDAIRRFESSRHDVIVLDFQMPDLNGLEVARRINESSPRTPILMLTLFLTHQLSDEARKAGIRGTCAKTDIGAVVEAVSALLREETYFPN